MIFPTALSARIFTSSRFKRMPRAFRSATTAFPVNHHRRVRYGENDEAQIPLACQHNM
jgi:hypothetical protein